jgi:hypothetical protein
MVSECELLINVVISSKPKALSGLGQKAYSRLSLSYVGTHGLTTVGEKAEPNLLLSFMRNTVSPIVRQHRSSSRYLAGNPQGKLLVERVRERGESERRPVVGRIGVRALPRPERVPTSAWCSCRRPAF